MKKNKWNTMNGIFVKGQVTTMLEEGKSKQEVVDFFYNAGMGGHFLFGASSRESIEKAVNEIIEINNKPKKTGFFSKLFNWL
jgi:hypothetical protein